MRRHGSTSPAPCNWLMLLLLLLSSAAADAPSEGCYERIAVGHRIKAADVIATLPVSSLTRCREACDRHPSNLCNSFGFGIGRKLNGTCELSSASVPSDPIPPFIHIESTSTLRLHSSKSGSSAQQPSNDTSDAAAPTPSASPSNSTNSTNSTTPDDPASAIAGGNSTEKSGDGDPKGTLSEKDNETAPPLETESDVDFDVYAKRPSSLCQRSPGAIDPWILRPLPSAPPPPSSTPPSPPPSPGSPPSSRPPASAAPPSHPQHHHHHHHHHHHGQRGSQGAGGDGPRWPVPSNRLQPPPLFQTPAMQGPPYPFRPSPSPPAATFLPPYNDGSFGPPPSHPHHQQPSYPPQHHRFSGPPMHNGIPHGGGFSHNGVPYGGISPNGHHNGGDPYGGPSLNGPPNGGGAHSGAPHGVPPNGFPNNGAPHNGVPPNGIPHGGAQHNGAPHNGAPHNGAPQNGAPHNGVPHNGVPHNGVPHNGAPHNGAPHNGVPHNGVPHGSVPPNSEAPHNGGPHNGAPHNGVPPNVPDGGAPYGGPPPFAGAPGAPHGAAPHGGAPNHPPPSPQQPGSQNVNGEPPNFGDGANMIPSVPCFHRVATGRLIAEALSHRTMQSPNLDDCRRLCSTEHHFRCEGFVYRWDTRLCTLTAAPLSEIRFQEHSHTPAAEYFARTAIGHGICPPRDGAGSGSRGPQGPSGWPSRDYGVGGTSVGRPFAGPSGGGGGGIGAPWGSGRGGSSRPPHRGGSNGQQLPGFYGPPSADGGGGSGGSWGQQPEQTGPSDHHRFEVRGGDGGWGTRWRGGGGGGGGGWSGGGGNNGGGSRRGGGHHAGPPPASSSFRPVDRPASSGGGGGSTGPWPPVSGGGWSKGRGGDGECFVMVKRGFRLTPDGRPHPPPSDHEDAHAGDLVFMSIRVRSRDPRDCAQECYRNVMFHCEAFSYRFSGDPRTQGLSNCDLSGQPLKKLDPYKDLVQDRDYDVYGRTTGRACGDGAITVGPQSGNGHFKRPPPPRKEGSDTHHPPPPPISRPPERPAKPQPPSYLDNSIGTGSGWSDSGNQNGHKDQQDITVGGHPCAPGSSCTRHPDGGFWGCPVSSFGLEKERSSNAGSGRDWDYCCRPGHQCGYSEGYHLPWCYVGSADRDQWRPCSQEHYPPPSSVSSSSSNIDNTTIGNGHHSHDHHQNSINQVAYLYSEKQNQSNSHTASHHEHHVPHSITSLVSMPPSDLKKQPHNSEETDATIQKIFDLLSSSGKDQGALPVSADNKLHTSSIKSEEEEREEGRVGRENRAYSRRAEEVRHFYPKYSQSKPKPRTHEIRDDYDEESEETRIIQSNFTVVEETDE